MAAALKTAKAAPAWNPPAGTLPNFCSAAGSTAQANAALGLSDLQVASEDVGAGRRGRRSLQTLKRVHPMHMADAAGGTGPFTYLSIGMLRGGAWAMPELPGQKNSKAYMLGAYSAMSIPGASAAAGNRTADAQECVVVALSIGSLLVVVAMDDRHGSVDRRTMDQACSRRIKAS